MMKTLLQNFLKCGFTGWCLEIIFTALGALRRRDLTLKGQTSLWMFPIYGSISFLLPFFHLLKKFPVWIKGSLYASFIFIGEFLTGSFLKRKGVCPWNYRRSKFHIGEVIRLDFFPNWFLCGLLFEKLLTHGRPQPLYREQVGNCQK